VTWAAAKKARWCFRPCAAAVDNNQRLGRGDDDELGASFGGRGACLYGNEGAGALCVGELYKTVDVGRPGLAWVGLLRLV
jgi:hypothetical protein